MKAPQAVAFEVFTARMASWWPMATHHIGKAELRRRHVLIEPRRGGRCYERGVDGSESASGGEVLAWEPPARVLLAWRLTSQMGLRPGAADRGSTSASSPSTPACVERQLEHRGARGLRRAGGAGCSRSWARPTAGTAACSSITPRWRRARPSPARGLACRSFSVRSPACRRATAGRPGSPSAGSRPAGRRWA